MFSVKRNARDNLAKFFYDSAKVSFAILVIGLLARPKFSFLGLLAGFFFTFVLLTIGVTIDSVALEESR